MSELSSGCHDAGADHLSFYLGYVMLIDPLVEPGLHLKVESRVGVADLDGHTIGRVGEEVAEEHASCCLVTAVTAEDGGDVISASSMMCSWLGDFTAPLPRYKVTCGPLHWALVLWN